MKHFKTSKTIKPFTTNFMGLINPITVPTGSIVSNKTAMGYDDNYRFWTDFHKEAKRITGFKDSILKHDLTYYGINVPGEYCEPYEES